MEKQMKLYEDISIVGERKPEPEPEIRVIKNTYLSAMGLVKEEVIMKTWILPVKPL